MWILIVSHIVHGLYTIIDKDLTLECASLIFADKGLQLADKVTGFCLSDELGRLHDTPHMEHGRTL